MFVNKYGLAVLTTALAVLVLSAPAEANPRCGFDRYGYHPPDFRGCYDRYAYPPAPYPVYPAPVAVYLPPPPSDGYYAAGIPPGPGCYYDNGYDMRVHRVCYGGW